MKTRIAIAAAALVAGCSGGGDIQPLPHSEYNPLEDVMGGASGTRLKRRMLVSSDGARQFVGWYDAELGTNCVFKELEQGTMYCVPEDAATEPDWGDPSKFVFYTDSACTQAMKLWRPSAACGDTVPKYALNFFEDECGDYTIVQLYKIGESTAPPDDLSDIYIKSNTGCTSYSAGDSAVDYSAYSAVEIGLQSLVTAEKSTD